MFGLLRVVDGSKVEGKNRFQLSRPVGNIPKVSCPNPAGLDLKCPKHIPFPHYIVGKRQKKKKKKKKNSERKKALIFFLLLYNILTSN